MCQLSGKKPRAWCFWLLLFQIPACHSHMFDDGCPCFRCRHVIATCLTISIYIVALVVAGVSRQRPTVSLPDESERVSEYPRPDSDRTASVSPGLAIYLDTYRVRRLCSSFGCLGVVEGNGIMAIRGPF